MDEPIDEQDIRDEVYEFLGENLREYARLRRILLRTVTDYLAEYIENIEVEADGRTWTRVIHGYFGADFRSEEVSLDIPGVHQGDWFAIWDFERYVTRNRFITEGSVIDGMDNRDVHLFTEDCLEPLK